MSIVDAPKTGTFQMRINPEIKKQVESIYAKCGMTLTDAVNAFFQQSLNRVSFSSLRIPKKYDLALIDRNSIMLTVICADQLSVLAEDFDRLIC